MTGWYRLTGALGLTQDKTLPAKLCLSMRQYDWTVQIDKCFGFESAVEEAQRALLAGYVEAASARSGLGLIKLMGRQSGYIAMQASMASGIFLF